MHSSSLSFSEHAFDALANVRAWPGIKDAAGSSGAGWTVAEFVDVVLVVVPVPCAVDSVASSRESALQAGMDELVGEADGVTGGATDKRVCGAGPGAVTTGAFGVSWSAPV